MGSTLMRRIHLQGFLVRGTFFSRFLSGSMGISSGAATTITGRAGATFRFLIHEKHPTLLVSSPCGLQLVKAERVLLHKLLTDLWSLILSAEGPRGFGAFLPATVLSALPDLETIVFERPHPVETKLALELLSLAEPSLKGTTLITLVDEPSEIIRSTF